MLDFEFELELIRLEDTIRLARIELKLIELEITRRLLRNGPK